MVCSTLREQYRLIRYEYYHAGRTLHLMGNFHSAGIMFGYTIETIMKAGLIEVLPKEQQLSNKILMHSHDVKGILAECNKYELFTDIKVSRDFLEHVHYHFQRYPIQIKKAMDEASKQNSLISNSIDWIHFYDDMIVQLDSSIYELTSDPLVSIFCLTFLALETRNARDILRENAHALQMYDKYVSLIYDNMPERQDLIIQIQENFSRGPEFYWNPDAQQKVSYETIVAIAKKYNVSEFCLPRWKSSNGFREFSIP